MNPRKPPLGLKPRYIHVAERIADIRAAINRYIDAGRPVPHVWIDEYNELTREESDGH